MYTDVYSPNPEDTWQKKTGRSVLVVEDDDAIRDSLVTVLTDEGFVVYEALNGREALRLLEGENIKPALILLDLVMPQMGGAEFLAEMSTRPHWQDVPVALLSATRAGTTSPLLVANLAKPVEIDELLSVVHRFADAAHAPAAIAHLSY